MTEQELKSLIDTFRAYRDLLAPIGENLSAFMTTYEGMRADIERLNTAFGGGIKENLDGIYRNLSGQAERAADLSARIDGFTRAAEKYTAGVDALTVRLQGISERLTAVGALEARAEEQIGRLDTIIEEKSKSYNVKELQRTLDAYHASVARVAEFINRDVADALGESNKKLASLEGGIEGIIKAQRGAHTSLEQLLEGYGASAELLRKIAERGDVNESYIFEILDRWADDRKVKRSKW